jgi:hypothetical protein
LVSRVRQDRKEECEGCLLLCGVHEGASGPSRVLGEVPLTDVGVVALELVEEFVSCREPSVWFADTWDSVDYELLESVVSDEVE